MSSPGLSKAGKGPAGLEFTSKYKFSKEVLLLTLPLNILHVHAS
jgi:hypothetical protein